MFRQKNKINPFENAQASDYHFFSLIRLDQTASELELHRILYYIKTIQSTVLSLVSGLILIIAELTYSALTGKDNLYLLNRIYAFKTAMKSPEFGGTAFVVAFTLILFVTAILVLSVWPYFSITNVWKKSLKIQSVFMMFFSVIFLLAVWVQLQFVSLASIFSMLIVINYVLWFFIAAHISMSLWRVSRLSEKSSFTAILNLRLTSGPWTYFNKLMNLPRTPFRNPRIATAYLLAFLGSVVIFVCFMYLTSLGNIVGKQDLLLASCKQIYASCAARSSILAQQTLVWLGISILGFKVGMLMQSGSRYLGGLSVSEVLRNPNQRFVLYLRPFDVDEVILPKPRLSILSKLISFRPFPARIEEELFDVSDGYCPLIAVGKPGKKLFAKGGLAYREYVNDVGDSSWKKTVDEKVNSAASIVILLKDTVGVQWELSEIIARHAVSKTLFLFVPEAKDPAVWLRLAKAVLPIFGEAGLVPSSFEFKGQPMGFYFKDGYLVQIENANWTTTSYRTAFSHFLTERSFATVASCKESKKRSPKLRARLNKRHKIPIVLSEENNNNDQNLATGGKRTRWVVCK